MNLTPERIDELRRELRALPPAPRIRTTATKLEAIEKVAPELLSHGLGHQLAGALQSHGLQIGAVLEDVAKALVEDRRRPSRAHHARVREADQEIAKRRRVENAGVVEDDERHSTSVAEAVLLRFGGELIENLLALSLVALLVRDEIGGLHATMSADHAEGDLAFV